MFLIVPEFSEMQGKILLGERTNAPRDLFTYRINRRKHNEGIMTVTSENKSVAGTKRDPRLQKFKANGLAMESTGDIRGLSCTGCR